MQEKQHDKFRAVKVCTVINIVLTVFIFCFLVGVVTQLENMITRWEQKRAQQVQTIIGLMKKSNYILDSVMQVDYPIKLLRDTEERTEYMIPIGYED